MSDGPAASVAIGGRDVLDALARQPGGRQLMTLAHDRDDVAIVGGAVRDLLLGRTPRELDVIVDGDAAAFAGELAAMLAARTTAHERFGTAVVEWEAGRVDIAGRRAESYAAPGALPDVRAGSVEEDLSRRDFTVNALAVTLAGAHAGEIQAVEHAHADLISGRLRVLHERSFRDDPTRLLRLARYRARLGFAVEPATAELAADALAAGALQTVSPARVGAELRLALGEPDALGALAALADIGVLTALDPGLSLDAPVAQRALELLPDDGRADLLLMASLLTAGQAGAPTHDARALSELLDGLQFSAGERDRVSAAALRARSLAADLAGARRPSQLGRALAGQPVEAVALAGALELGEPASAGASAAAQAWLTSHRHVRLAITGDDLLTAGVAAGPEVGVRLQAALDRKLDGELDGGRDAELDAALQART